MSENLKQLYEKLRDAGYCDVAIAEHLGMTLVGLQNMLKKFDADSK